MASATRLGPRDLDGALAVVAEAASTGGVQPFELPVIERLLGLVPADRVGYFEYRKPSDDIYKVEQSPAGIAWGSERIKALIKWWPLYDPLWERTEHTVRFSDLLTRKQLLRNPWYIDVMRPESIEHTR